MKKQKILIVTCKELGAGHYSVAKTIAAKLGENSEVEVDIYNWKSALGKGYEFVLSNVPDLWKFFYKFFESTLSIEFTKGYGENPLRKLRYEGLIKDYDKIIFTVHGAQYIGYSDDLSDRTFVIITDYGVAAKVWGTYKPNTFFICDTVTEEFLRSKPELNTSKILLAGLPVNEQIFSLSKKSKLSVREELGITSKKFYLIVGGGAGDKNLESVFKELITLKAEDAQFLVICGRNKVLFEKFTKKIEEEEISNIKVERFLPVEKILKYYRASDVVVTKAGAITLTELVNLNTPIAIMFAHPHEEGNMQYIVSNNVGIYENDPEKLFQRVLNLSDEELLQLSENSKKISKYNSADKISDHIIKSPIVRSI